MSTEARLNSASVDIMSTEAASVDIQSSFSRLKLNSVELQSTFQRVLEISTLNPDMSTSVVHVSTATTLESSITRRLKDAMRGDIKYGIVS